MNKKTIFTELVEIIEDTKYFLKKNTLPVYKYETEPDPNDLHFLWKPLTKKSGEQKALETKEKQRSNRETINFPCSLCTGKVSGIKNFFYRGRKPILVLHYSGATTPKEKPFVKKNPNQIFREQLTEKVWGDLIQKAFGFSYLELFHQEYPACNFSHTQSTEMDWKKRVDTCKVYVEENIKDFQIEAIVILGSSAKLVFGAEKAKESLGKLIEWEIAGKKIPVLTIRSPEALVFLDEKSKGKASDEDTALFQYAQERNSLEESFLNQLKQLQSVVS
ncbi:hypothetical protein [Leptospira idonii]|uniref:Uracil-DNA glycosylase-like domain-containing protein n=1 Tax=Leptospira idonii TaxID=1193500 RepID=A0A4R9LXV6_9LEPT|nr:hypothetical protein [Leptospira idonii]TGN18522.1 hypothetical protein EHS15_14130 [Leptospira idonii]